MGNTCESKPSKPSINSKPQIIYWCVHGRSDFCQAMLCAGGILFELDEKTANDWPAAKNDTPFGQIPVLKHGDVVIAQGGAMTRYCARLAGLYPSDEVEASICDMYIDEMMDIFQGLFKAKNAPDKDSKIAAWKMLETEHLPKHYGFLEKHLNSSGKQFLGGDDANAADVAFFAVNNIYSKAGLDVDAVLSAFPKLKAALEGTLKNGRLSSFPDRHLYFSSDPKSSAF